MFMLLLLVLGLSVPMIADAQVNCIQLGNTLSCDSSRGNTSITEFSRGQGIITQQDRNGSSIDPYTVIGQDSRRSATRSEGLRELKRLPSYGSSSSGRSSTSEERQAIRDSGRIPW